MDRDELIIASNAMTCGEGSAVCCLMFNSPQLAVTSLARFDEKTNQRLQRLIEDYKTSRQVELKFVVLDDDEIA